MLYGTKNVSMRTIFTLTAGVLLLAGGVGAASAANTGVTPQLVPYTMQLIAGNSVTPTGSPAHASTAQNAPNVGYGGDGQVQNPPTTFATLNGPNYLAVDAAGNVYWTDQGNAVIREVNAQTGLVNTVAGMHPTGCSGFLSCHENTGCADGVPALGNALGGGLAGIAVDANGNIYFADTITQTISVVYRGGTRVANFITLEDPGGVSTSGGVQVGYVYHVAGTVSLKTCAGMGSSAATATAAAVPAGDGNLAFNSGATFAAIGPIGLDSAGNLYVGDAGLNSVLRVINTQAQAQTYFQYTVQPGYIQSIVNCGSLTVVCPVLGPFTLAATGVGGPANGGVFNSLANGNGAWMSTDGYGNLYELNTKGSNPTNAIAVAYAGGAALANMIANANNGAASSTFLSTGLKAVAGDFYYLTNFPLRASSSTADTAGNVYYLDNHYGQIYRFDANSPPGGNYLEYSYLDSSGPTSSDANRGTLSTVDAAVPEFCYPGGTPSTTNPVLTGYQTIDEFGNGCPVITAEGVGLPHSGTGFGTVLADGPGNVWIADKTNQMIREVTTDTTFPSTPVGQQWNTTNFKGEQGLQVHFDASNLPVYYSASGNSGNAVTSGTSSFSIAPGSADFTINPIQAEYTNATTSGLSLQATGFTYPIPVPANTVEVPSCTNLTGDKSTDCVVNVIFSPTLPGLRISQLVATTYNGSVYTYGLSGIGTGPQLAIDGGAQATVPVTGLGNPGQVTVTQQGMLYIADPANNRVVVEPVGGGTLTTVGTGLKNPMGVAVDPSGNVYISDTGNNRVVEVSQATGAQTVIGNIEAPGAPAYSNYTFKSPEGLAVDVRGNVFVADTGNGKVVEIPSDPRLGAATPLLQYPNAPSFSTPVAIALDSFGNIYVADPGHIQVVEIPAGGGDMQTLPGTVLTGFGASLTAPSGVAVDAAGDVYVSDSGTNQVYELPAGPGLSTATLPINFTGLNLTSGSYTGGSLSLDANGNLYAADSGNGRILFENRQNPTVACGLLAQSQPAATCGGAAFNASTATPSTLTVTNIGNANATLSSPVTNVTSANAAFTLSNNCATGAPPAGGLLPGVYCTISPTFLPTTNGALSETFTVNGSAAQTVTLTGTGENPLAALVLSNSSPVAGSPITVTATLTQPHINGDTPSGAVTFSYTVDGGTPVTVTPTPMAAGSGGTSTASFAIPAASVLQGHQYVVSATYQGDALDSQTVATPLSIYVPGVAVTVNATPVTYTYGQPVPAITGTVTGIPAADAASLKYTFVTAATSSSAVGVYPIKVVFSGATDASNYGFGSQPPVYATGSTTALATVTENAAPLTVKVNNATIPYGAQNLVVTSTSTGLVNGDQIVVNYSPSSAQASILAAGTYPIVPTVVGKAAGNYKVTVTNGTLTVTQAQTGLTIIPTVTQLLPANIAADPITIILGSLVTAGKGTPSGTITITDVFTPIIMTAPGTGAATTTVLPPIPLVAGTVKYTITSATPGTHSYSFAYSGDANFLPSATGTPTAILVNNSDFTVSAPTTPVIIAPGISPGGSGSVAGQATATPETAVVSVVSILGYAGTIYLGCEPQNPSYVTCTVSPPVVNVTTSSTAASPTTSTVSISTPATLPLGFFGTSSLRLPVTTTVLAFLPLGLLAFCVRRSRRRLSNALWMLILIALIGTGLNGCDDTSVHYYTPVPSGIQTVTVYACTVQSSCTATPTAPITGTGAGVIRSFTIPINIQ